jgi:hypothetical protein
MDETLAMLSPYRPGGAATTHTVTSGQTYTVKTTDATIRMDTSGGATATAVLPVPSYIGEQHTFFWFNWGVGQTPPTINTSSGSIVLVPFTGMTGANTFATTSVINEVGATYTLEWDGSEWLSR